MVWFSISTKSIGSSKSYFRKIGGVKYGRKKEGPCKEGPCKERQVMESNKRTLLKTLSWETFHLIGVAGIISAVSYMLTGNIEYEYATLGAIGYIAWEALGYYIHERLWTKVKKIK